MVHINLQDETEHAKYSNVTDNETSEYYGDLSVRPPRDAPPLYGAPPVPVAPPPDQNCYVETPCTR